MFSTARSRPHNAAAVKRQKSLPLHSFLERIFKYSVLYDCRSKQVQYFLSIIICMFFHSVFSTAKFRTLNEFTNKPYFPQETKKVTGLYIKFQNTVKTVIQVCRTSESRVFSTISKTWFFKEGGKEKGNNPGMNKRLSAPHLSEFTRSW